MGQENIDSFEELKRLDQQVELAAELAALKPIYFRLNEIIQAFPGDFDIQFTGNEIKQRLMARGTVLKQQEQQAAAAAPPPAAPPVEAAAAEPASPPEAPGPQATVEPAAAPPAPAEPAPPEPAPVVAEPSMTLVAPPEAPASVAPPETPVAAAPMEPPAVPEPPSPPAPQPEIVAAPPAAVEPPPAVEPGPPVPREHPEMFIAEPSPTFALFPLFAGAPPPPEPPAPPAYFSENLAPEPSSPYERTVMGSSTPLPLIYPLLDSASPEPPPLSLGVMTEAAHPVGPPPPSEPAILHSPASVAVAAPPEPPAPAPQPPATPFAQPTPLFDFGPAPTEPAALSGTAIYPAPPVAPPPVMPEMQPPPPAPIAPRDFAPPMPAAPLDPMPQSFSAGPPPAPPIFDSALPETMPPPVVQPPQRPMDPPMRVPPPPRRSHKSLIFGLVAAALAVAAAAGFLVVRQTRLRTAEKVAARNAAAVQVDIATTPPGASVKVTGEQTDAGNPTSCVSNCKLDLTPGTYQISAALDGFEPAAQSVTVKPLTPASITLPLQPQPQSLRLLTDLQQGKVTVDDQAPVDLQEGQLVLDKVAPGEHKIKVAGKDGDAAFSFQVGDARIPAVTSPVTAHNMVAVLVSSFGKKARVITNAGPWKLAVNGQPQGDASPGGTDLTSFQPGVNEIVVGEGKDQRNMSETFTAAPMLTAFLKTDVNAGTLIVSTGQDGVRVFVNGKENPRLTQHGQLRLPVLGKVAVHVVKTGFQDEPVQNAEVKKGAEVRLQFDLKPLPRFGSLQIRGAAAGVEVLLDQRSAGIVGPDGLFTLGDVPPGEHTIELRREQRFPKRIQRAFQAGQTVVLTGADVVLAVSNGTVRVSRSPASTVVAYHRAEEQESHELRGSQIELPAGTYIFQGTAPGFMESVMRFQLAAGESKQLDFILSKERAAAAPVISNAVSLFEDPASWAKEGDSWVHRGGGFLLIKPSPRGVLTFTVELVKGGGVFRSGQIHWCVQYVDAKNYLLFEIDRKNFWAGVIQAGKRYERVKAPHGLANQKSYTIQVDVAPDHLIQKVQAGGEWKVLDNFAEPGRDYTQGKFGFLVPGNDEIAITEFKFQPR